LPQAGDETLHLKDNPTQSQPAEIEKKKVTEETDSIDTDTSEDDEIQEPIPVQAAVKSTDSAPVNKQEIEQLESDQEKMILQLFDGKFIE